MRTCTASRVRAKPTANDVLPVPGRPPMTINLLLMATVGSPTPHRYAMSPLYLPCRSELDDARVVGDLAVHHGEYRARPPHVRIAHAEVIAIEHNEVRELAFFDRAEITLAIEIPSVTARVGVERLLTRDLLAGIDLLTKHVEPSRRIVQREPWVMWRDMHAVLVHAGVDAARKDLRIERSHRQAVGTRNAV